MLIVMSKPPIPALLQEIRIYGYISILKKGHHSGAVLANYTSEGPCVANFI